MFFNETKIPIIINHDVELVATNHGLKELINKNLTPYITYLAASTLNCYDNPYYYKLYSNELKKAILKHQNKTIYTTLIKAIQTTQNKNKYKQGRGGGVKSL